MAQMNLSDLGVEIPETIDPDDIIGKASGKRLILPGDVFIGRGRRTRENPFLFL